MVPVVVGEQLLVGRFELVVDFVGESDLDLVDHLRRVEPAEALLEERAEHVGVAQVGRDRLADARVLHLDGDGAFGTVAIAHDRPMDLADRRGRDRLVVELDEQLVDRTPELGLDGGPASSVDIGGASDWSWASATRSGSGRPSSR